MTSPRWRLRYLWLLGRRVVVSFFADSGVTWAAATAFYLVLSVPPLLIAFTSIALALVGEPQARTFITEQFGQFLPAAQSTIEQVVHSTVSATGPAAALSVAFLLVSGSRVFAALSRATNMMWHHVDDAGCLRRQLGRLALLLAVGGLFVASFALDLAAAAAGRLLNPPTPVAIVVQAQLLPAMLVFIGLLSLYRVMPRGAAGWRSAAIGALVGTALLRAAQGVFTVFLQTFGGFSTAYGPLASVAVLMTWAFIASAAVLLAAELVSVLERRKVPGRKHEASGPARRGEAQDRLRYTR